jgi:hypothetical protein
MKAINKVVVDKGVIGIRYVDKKSVHKVSNEGFVDVDKMFEDEIDHDNLNKQELIAIRGSYQGEVNRNMNK